MTEKTLITTSIDYDKDGLQIGALRLPHSVHRSAYGHIPIPILVAKNGSGPTVLLTGGVHGDEYEGPVALARLGRILDVSRIQGRIIILPMLNQPAFVAGQRTSPIDGVNLNRSFPGKRNGTVTEQIAHYVTTELFPRADVNIDFHAGGSSLNYLPVLLMPRWKDPVMAARVEAQIEAFAPERVIYFDSLTAMNGDDRTMGNAAYHNGCDYIGSEFGGGSTLNLDGLATAEAGIRGILEWMGIMKPTLARAARSAPIKRLEMDDPGLHAHAHRRGFFEPAFRLGDILPAGALAGHIYDIDDPWATPAPVHFKTGGMAVCIRTFSLVEAGDCLGHLASEI